MAQLAIKGHPTRGREVIEILEMLGGKQFESYNGGAINWCYTIINGSIDWDYPSDKYKVFSLEEFLEKFPYKVGDKVSSKYLKNYKIEKMEWEDTNNRVIYKLQGMGWYSADELQPYKEETMEEGDKAMAPTLVGEDYSGRRFGYKIPQGYEFDCIQNNEIIIKPTKPQYPKTYDDCCEVLGKTKAYQSVSGYKTELLEDFQKLLICRDAYWKIAGEQMGLGKPWEPDWTKDTEKYVIYPFQYLYSIDVENYRNTFLAFPTREMRDAFYENFKELIENVKELL